MCFGLSFFVLCVFHLGVDVLKTSKRRDQKLVGLTTIRNRLTTEASFHISDLDIFSMLNINVV